MEVEQVVLTGQVWHSFELLFPVLRHLDGRVLLHHTVCGHTLLRSMFHDLLQVVGLLSCKYVEEVRSWWSFALRVLVRKVKSELGVFFHEWVDVLDAELLVVRHLDVPHLVLLIQVLLALDYLLQEVLVQDAFVRQVELFYNGVSNVGQEYLQC